MKLEVAPIEKRLSELKEEAKKRLLTESEKNEVERLRNKAESIRKHYESGNLKKLVSKTGTNFDIEEQEQIKKTNSRRP